MATATLTTYGLEELESYLERIGALPKDGIFEELGARFTQRWAKRIGHQSTQLGIYRHLWSSVDKAAASVVLYVEWLREYFEVFPSLELPDGDLLDLGSGSGVITCFHAAMRPGAQVVGVDLLPEGVAAGTALAAKLGLGNVTFIEGDVTTVEAGRTFDVVASTAVRQLLGWGHDVYPAGPGVSGGRAFAERIAAHLAPGGVYTSFERLPEKSMMVSWFTDLAAVGLEATSAQFVRFDCWQQRMPLATFRAVDRPALPACHGIGMLYESIRELYNDECAQVWIGGIEP